MVLLGSALEWWLKKHMFISLLVILELHLVVKAMLI